MTTCKKCDKSFPAFVEINGEQIDCRKRAYCVECSPKGTRRFCGPSRKSNYVRVSDEDFIKYVSESTSVAQLLRKCNKAPSGGNYYTVHKRVQNLKLDTTHWTGQGWTKDKQLKDWSAYSRSQHLKKNLLLTRGKRCESCTRSKWLKKPIPIELHHIDGDRTNNSYENLQLLCPNCHALTDNWKGRGRKSPPSKPA